MGCTKEQIIAFCQDAFTDAKTFYKQKIVNYRGKTSDTNDYYTEVVAEFLCNNIKTYKSSIPMITREATYKTPGHDGEHSNNSNREEEIIAMEMFKQGKCDYIGNIIDYQTPLKNRRSDEAGKIDLLSFDGKILRILELKKPDSTESMLRCVLEGYTYMKTVNADKLIDNFELPKGIKIKACPFVFKNGVQYEEFKENRPWLIKLMNLLDSKPYFINEIDDKFIVEG